MNQRDAKKLAEKEADALKKYFANVRIVESGRGYQCSVNDLGDYGTYTKNIFKFDCYTKQSDAQQAAESEMAYGCNNTIVHHPDSKQYVLWIDYHNGIMSKKEFRYERDQNDGCND